MTQLLFQTKFASKFQGIDFEAARIFHHEYLKEPVAVFVNSNNQPIRGFHIRREDLEEIYNTGKKGARIYLGYDKPNKMYKLMLVGVGDDYANDITKIADEFFPCPDECPEPPAGSSSEVRKKIYENDLSYESTDQTYVYQMTFGGTLIKCRYK
jgi:hypothetical protein